MMPKNFTTYITLMLAGTIAGCSSTTNFASSKGADSVKLPIKFSGYRSFYDFVAQNDYGGMIGMYVTNTDVLLKLASDSTTKIIPVDYKVTHGQYVYLVEPHYYNGGIYDNIRGAQNNGSFYILRPLTTNFIGLDTDKGFELLGMFAGNSCRYTEETGKPAFITHWHMSAAESPETTYEWNGKFFEELK